MNLKSEKERILQLEATVASLTREVRWLKTHIHELDMDWETGHVNHRYTMPAEGLIRESHKL